MPDAPPACLPLRWRRVQKWGTTPSPRRGHAAVMWRHYMVVFGGTGNRQISNSLFMFDLVDLVWSRVSTEGELPCKRYGHTIVEYNDKLYVFGGFKTDGLALDDTWEHDLQTHRWREVTFGESPVPHRRGGHTACLWGSKMVVFGGSHRDNGVSILDLNTLEWDHLLFESPDDNLPVGRFYHTSVVRGDSMIVFGGCKGSSGSDSLPLQPMFREVAVLDFLSMKWRCVPCRHAVRKDTSLSRHTAVMLPDQKRIVVFGGKGESEGSNNQVYVLNCDDAEGWSWEQPCSTFQNRRISPCARYRHSCLLVPSGYTSQNPLSPLAVPVGMSPERAAQSRAGRESLLVFGGKDGEQYFQDMFILDCDHLTLTDLVAIKILHSGIDFKELPIPTTLKEWIPLL